MPDREKVIKEWAAVLNREPLDAPWDLIDDTVSLLKEQEPVPLIHSAGYEEYWDVESICPKCNAHWISLVEDHFCPQCGQAVKDDA